MLTRYLKEFNIRRTGVIKARVKLFCLLTLAVYIATSVLSWIISPAEFRPQELFTWLFLIMAAAFVLFINGKANTLRGAKINAFLFAVFLVTALTAVFFIYPSYVGRSSEVFLVTFFFISFVIPWETPGVILTGILNLLGYSVLYLWAAIKDDPKIIFTGAEYGDGLILLAIALIACIVIRRQDDKREKENFILMKQLEERKTEMEKELEVARDVHKTLIPKSKITENAEIAVSYMPVSMVGGDYATFHSTKEGNLFFLIGDITGHGIPAALLVNRLYGEVESLFAQNNTPGKLLNELDKFVQEHFRNTQMYLSVCAGLIDFGREKLFYSNYGHPPQILHQRQGNKICLLESQTYFLGVDAGDDQAKVFEGVLNFGHKDRIILFTDGLIEVKGGDNQLYGMARLKDFVKDHMNESPAIFNSNLLKDADGFRQGPVSDDIFLLTIDIK